MKATKYTVIENYILHDTLLLSGDILYVANPIRRYKTIDEEYLMVYAEDRTCLGTIHASDDFSECIKPVVPGKLYDHTN